jgi:hypothetical protein
MALLALGYFSPITNWQGLVRSGSGNGIESMAGVTILPHKAVRQEMISDTPASHHTKRCANCRTKLGEPLCALRGTGDVDFRVQACFGFVPF